MKNEIFDRSRLNLLPLRNRRSDLGIEAVIPLESPPRRGSHVVMKKVAEAVVTARGAGRPVIMMLGGHVVRSGTQLFLADLIEKGMVTALAMNGSVMIHDFELAMTGATTESVQRYLSEGQFGLWTETGILNRIVHEGFQKDPNVMMGNEVGRFISESDYPHRSLSLLAAAFKAGIPATVHVGIGYDIIHEHPNCDGAATGAASYNDFLRFARVMEDFDGGVVMNFGSAVMAPEVFLKALAMARNVAHREGRKISGFTSLVCDLRPIPDPNAGEPEKTDPAYFFRPLKTMLIRAVRDSGSGYSVREDHSRSIPELWRCIREIIDEKTR